MVTDVNDITVRRLLSRNNKTFDRYHSNGVDKRPQHDNDDETRIKPHGFDAPPLTTTTSTPQLSTMSQVSGAAANAASKAAASKFQQFMNHPAGPKCVTRAVHTSRC